MDDNDEVSPALIESSSKGQIAENLATPEQQAIVDSAVKFSKYLTSRWPQIDDGRRPIIEIDDQGTQVELPQLPPELQAIPKLNYYLSGSLATMLLSRAENFTELDPSDPESMKPIMTRVVPESARQILTTFARPIGDLDYVPTDSYKGKKSIANKMFNKVSAEKYKELRSRFLMKGGGGPAFSEIPDDAKACLHQPENGLFLMVDPIEAAGPKRLAKITVEGQDYFIPRPDTLLAYKVLHLLQNYSTKPEKFNADFSKLVNSLGQIYTPEELEGITREVLAEYEENMEAIHEMLNRDEDNPPSYKSKIPSMIDKVLADERITPQIRVAVEKLKEIEEVK